MKNNFLILFNIFVVVFSCRPMETGNELKKFKALPNFATGKDNFWYDHCSEKNTKIKSLDNGFIALLDLYNQQIGFIDVNAHYLIEKNNKNQYKAGLLDTQLSKDDNFTVHPNGKEIFWTKNKILKSYNISTKEHKEILSFAEFFPLVKGNIVRSWVQAIQFDSNNNNDPVLCLCVKFKKDDYDNWAFVKSAIKGKDYSLEYEDGASAVFYKNKMCVYEYEGNISIYNFNDKKIPQLIQTLKFPDHRAIIQYATVSFDGLVAIAMRSAWSENDNICILNLNDNKYTLTSFFKTNDYKNNVFNYLKENAFEYPFFCIANSVLAVNFIQKDKECNNSIIGFIDIKNLKFIDTQTFYAKSKYDKSTLKSVFPDGGPMIIAFTKSEDNFTITEEYNIYEVPEKVQEYIGLKKKNQILPEIKEKEECIIL